MGNVINVDYKEMFEMGKKFEKQAMDLKKLSEELDSAFIGLNDNWLGFDYDSYYSNSNKLINSLNNEMLYMLSWSEFLTKYSYKYSGYVEEGMERINRIQQTFLDNGKNMKELNNG